MQGPASLFDNGPVSAANTATFLSAVCPTSSFMWTISLPDSTSMNRYLLPSCNGGIRQAEGLSHRSPGMQNKIRPERAFQHGVCSCRNPCTHSVWGGTDKRTRLSVVFQPETRSPCATAVPAVFCLRSELNSKSPASSSLDERLRLVNSCQPSAISILARAKPSA